MTRVISPSEVTSGVRGPCYNVSHPQVTPDRASGANCAKSASTTTARVRYEDKANCDDNDNDDDDDDDQAKPCIKPSKKQLRRHLSSAELTNTARAERDK